MARGFVGSLVAVCVTAAMAFGPASALAADSCPNAAYRNGAGADLPDCRAWEQVSPVDKRGNQVSPSFGAYPSPTGDTVLYTAFANVADQAGAPYQAPFASHRGIGWSTFGLTGPLDPLATDDLLSRPIIGYSDDRSKALVVSPRKVTPGAVEGASNLYVRDTTDGSYALAATVPGLELYTQIAALFRGDSGNVFFGASADFTHIAFTTPLALVPDALTDGSANLYDISGGRVSLVSRDVDGTALAVQGLSRLQVGSKLVSDDGRRITFKARTTGGASAVFQRIDGDSTVVVSRSHRQGQDAPGSPPFTDESALPSADGKRVTFATADPTNLVENGDASTLYRWSADGDTLTDLLAGVSLPGTASIDSFDLLHVSRDERYVWFTLTDLDSRGAVVPELAVLDTQRKLITLKAVPPDSDTSSDVLFVDGSVRFSPDGTKLAVVSLRKLSGQDNTTAGRPCNAAPGAPRVCQEAFVFDATQPDAVPICISCGAPGTPSEGDAGLGAYAFGLPVGMVVTDDGRVFFDTPQPLASTDANDSSDVYEYAPGRPRRLISSGTGRSRALVEGVTPSGNDVFFFTADQLVPQDDDDALDVYDARVGGGLAAQQVAAARPGASCPTANCPASHTAVPAAEAPATSRFLGRSVPAVFSVGRVSASALRTASSTGRLRVSVRVGAAGRVSARASARVGGRSATIGRSSTSARKAARLTLTLKLTSAARRSLREKRRLTTRLSVTYSRAVRPAAQTFTLTAPRPQSSKKGGAR